MPSTGKEPLLLGPGTTPKGLDSGPASGFGRRGGFLGFRLHHAVCSFPTIGAVEGVCQENIPCNPEAVAPEGTTYVPVALGARPPENRAPAERAIGGMGKKFIEEEHAKTADESVEPQQGAIWKVHVKRG